MRTLPLNIFGAVSINFLSAISAMTNATESIEQKLTDRNT
jgi:hypothetical protein